jgi:alginate O-acetyltransferase complex protein AlgI
VLFTSFQFLVFFPIVVCIYFAIPHRFRWMILLAASYYYYMSWKPEYVFLIIASTLVDYFAGLRMGRLTEKLKRRKYVYFSLFVNLGLLFTFRYFNFFGDMATTIFNYIRLPIELPYLDVFIPLGISFYTFQTLSYTFDVYRGKIKPQKHLGIFALYVSFFPQLLAGPIERANRLLPQLLVKHDFNFDKMFSGLKLMLWGFFLKVVIADRLGIVVDHVYGNVQGYSGLSLILATYFFGFQIYCDFAGYSFIAIGAARIFGIDLMDNFKRPYLSKSISEFWRRWHISLYSWFLDYLYIPLGGNRVSKKRRIFNILAVFMISGLWHGAGWTFILWGTLHGIYLVLSSLTSGIKAKIVGLFRLDRLPRIYDLINIVATFNLVSFAWIFFRSNSLADALYVINHLFSGIQFNIDASVLGLSGDVELMFAAFSILFLLFVELLHGDDSMKNLLDKRHIFIRWTVYYLLIFSILLFGVFNEEPFIYFQF